VGGGDGGEPVRSHQAGELSLAKIERLGRASPKEAKSGALGAHSQPNPMDLGLGRTTLCHLKDLQYQRRYASKFAFTLSDSQIGTMTAQANVASSACSP
jgi:hypothetical protein